MSRHAAIEHRYPAPPGGLTIYAVGDVHGRADLLAKVHETVDADMARSASPGPVREIYVGDYIDRGSESKAVVDRLLARAAGRDIVFLRGNHEQYMLDWLDGRARLQPWKQVGALATLRSYGLSASMLTRPAREEDMRSAFAKAMPASHLAFYRRTQLSCVVGPYAFVHAGLRPGVPLAVQSSEDLMSIRASFLEFGGDLGHIVVHGHTPVQAPDMRRNRINIDTGAYVTHRLTCLKLGTEGASILHPAAAA